MIVGRTRTAIRAQILSDWSGYCVAAGFVLDTATTGWAYRLADSLAVDLLRVEANAESIAPEVFPETASETMLARHADVVQVPRDGGVAGRWTVTMTAYSATYAGWVTVAGRTLVRGSYVYSPVPSQVYVASGTATFEVQADEPGSAPDLAVGDVLAWDAPPVSIKPTVTVAAETVAATDDEPLATWADRVRSYRRARPASGSSAHLIELAEAHKDVYEAYAYPCLYPDAGTYNDVDLDTPGTWTLLVMGPPQGSALSNTRNLSAAAIARVRAYFAGTQDANGNPTPGGSRLYNAALAVADVLVENCVYNAGLVAVELTVTPDAAHRPVVVAMSALTTAATVRTVTVAGDMSDWLGYDVVLSTGTGATRGGWQLARVARVVALGGPTTRLEFDEDLDAAPGVPTTAYVAPLNYQTVWDRVVAYFDGFGPGDVPPGPDYAGVLPPTGVALKPNIQVRRRRFPPVSWKGTTDVVLRELEDAAMVDGMLTVAVTLPVAGSTAQPKELYRLDTLLIHL